MSTVDHDGQPTFGISNNAPQVDENKPALLSLPQFSKLHLEHILSHPPDSILFPFLHGLEGDNDAQNTFFASCSLPSPSPPASDASTTSTSPNLPNPTNHRHRTVKVPRHRGLVWVVCEDDLQAEPKRYARELALLRRRDPSYNANNIMTTDNDNSVGLSTPVLEGDSESSDYDDDDDDEDIDMEEDEVVLSPLSVGANAGVVPPDLMDVDGANGNQIQAQIPLGIEKPEEQDDAKHMHPVIQRLAPPVPMPIQTTELHLPSSLSSTSTATSESSSSSTSDNFSFSLPSSPESASISTSPTSTSTSPKPILTTPPSPNPSTAEPISSVSAGVLPAPTQTQITSASAALNAIPNPNADLALLTCTFRPCDIVRPVPMDTDAKESQAGGWEFVPAKVPDGISLRNFGIQVPIYTTLSDIVVYSPKGPTQNAYALAGKIQEAINKNSPTNSVASMNMLMPFVRFLERWLMPVVPPPTTPTPPPQSQMEPHPHSSAQQQSQQAPSTSSSSRRWSTVASFMPHFPSFPLSPSSFTSSPSSAAPGPTPASAPAPSRLRSLTSPSLSSAPLPPIHVHSRTRPLKILLYSLDGYTESSLAALCLLMAIKHLSLPEAYLELQVTKRRSFFVYQSDLGLLRRVESRLREEAERERVEKERERDRARGYLHNHNHNHGHEGEREINGNGKRGALGGGGGPPFTRHVQNHSAWGLVMENGWRVPSSVPPESATQQPQHQQQPPRTTGRPAAKSVSFGRPPPLLTSANEAFVPGTVPTPAPLASSTTQRRPRANTSPWLPSFNGTHHSWFNDRRFDGSFPSRVLPFLYLGNLNHASNAYMLHALGITHVVSVGECALVPPPYHLEHGNPHYAQPHHSHSMPLMNGKSPGDGSLWHEEREGRIKVLDIKNVCDDGIDTLEPQLEPICDWIDKARAEGGQVLVHCRVGVSRSATVTIAYVMKHLGLPLVDAYLIVRSRRLSVLIQPNMRLLYNLCGWEIKLAKARAGDSEENLRNELARTLSWPYLAKEVHALNEKYLHAS
ncbi:hypothetical protein H0H93_002598 [Arthromyces matolae]|nr:hypothetical protein H0H93_002598 [Arthromyces matolae]